MKFLFLFFVLTLFAIAHCRLEFDVGHRVPNKPNECYHRTYDMTLQMNTDYPNPKECGIVTCTKNYKVRLQKCDPPKPVTPPCRYEQDLKQVFPECCKKVVC